MASQIETRIRYGIENIDSAGQTKPEETIEKNEKSGFPTYIGDPGVFPNLSEAAIRFIFELLHINRSCIEMNWIIVFWVYPLLLSKLVSPSSEIG